MKGALIGAATVGGLGALIDRSISAADAIGKTADKIGACQSQDCADVIVYSKRLAEA